jgi:hypothetical protein
LAAIFVLSLGALPAVGISSVARCDDTGGDWPRDTLGLRFELGASFDYTNEIYYLDALVDTTFLHRQRFLTPQSRFAGVLLANLDGTRGARTTSYSLLNELSFGDRLRRDAAYGTWRTEIAPSWLLVATPRLEYRWDRTLDRNFEEYVANATVRVRRAWGDGATAGEMGVQGEYLRTTGPGAGLLTDRNAGALLVAVDHASLGGGDWRADYAFRARSFPDSSDRDHLEHEASVRSRWGWGAGHSLTLEAGSTRRTTILVVPTSLDNYWEERVAGDLLIAVGEKWAWPVHVEAEAQQYDVEDSLSYFDYEVIRAQTGWRAIRGLGWTLTAGPRAEWLHAKVSPGESYREVAGYLELELIGARTLWSVIPAAGWRHYIYRGGSGDASIDSHSPYAFMELDLIADQPVGGGFLLRVAGTGRTEYHTESIEDGASLYFSVDVRRLF